MAWLGHHNGGFKVAILQPIIDCLGLSPAIASLALHLVFKINPVSVNIQTKAVRVSKAMIHEVN